MSEAVEVEGTSEAMCLDKERLIEEGVGMMVEYEQETDTPPAS